jgi:hypothetical protein
MMRKITIVSIFLFLTLVSVVPFVSHAESQSLSVTPPLFQLSVEPGDIWQSSIRIVNPNEFPLTVYTEVVNFLPEGEGGQGKFMPVIQGDNAKATLAEWISIARGPHVIPAGQTQEVSFFVETPPDAAPGGHFAAILVNTEPPKDDASGPLALVTTQTVASLFFTRIEGDVFENADIREFSVEDRPLELPEAEFSLRFENKGNVHIQPQGDIIIMNMWGTTRGIIPVNHDTHFGNVLPTSIRDFRFTWKGERSLTDIGRYKAIATLAYGEDGVKSVTATTYFWVIPIKGALVTLAFLVVFIGGITWMIRLYIRRMLILAGVDPDKEESGQRFHTEREVASKVQKRTYKEIAAPLREGTLDLRARLRDAHETTLVLSTIIGFIIQYKKFFVALLILILGFVGLVRYVSEVRTTETEYEITITEGEAERVLTDEQIESTRTD